MPKGSSAVDRSASARQAASINDASEGLSKGSKAWVRGEQGRAWEAAEIKALNDNGTATVILEYNGQTVTIDLKKLLPANPKLQEGIPDLTHLSYLNEPGILYNLRYRYSIDNIYTFAGPVLIAMNPCKRLPLYTAEVANSYKAGARDVVHSAQMPPHIYLVAANAFRSMMREKASQSLIVNGESGAGKTETTKKAMQYFATLAGGTGVEDQVLETNPILEAFGNAKTLRNHNSSRFGKLIRIAFNQGAHICGATIKTYLLEKSRVVHQLPGERSYHIFYQLVRGASAAQKKEWHLPDKPQGFKFLAQSGCTDIDGVDDAEDFHTVCHALADVGISPEQQTALFRLLSGILWLGNLSFTADTTEQSVDATAVVADEAAANVCDLLGVTHAKLQRALTRKNIQTPTEIITKVLSKDESRDCRDALAKALYAATFDWLVARINDKLDQGKKSSGLSISILDIYGFEQFQRNSFEQLCINYANERLQQQFTRHLFKLEQQEYESEGIDWTKVEFIDNQECVDAIEATPPRGLGVLAVLDSQCRFPKATDATFLNTLKEALNSHSHFGTNPRQPRDFTILHYAGAVGYDTQGFLDKNKDTLNADLYDLMASADGAVSPLAPALGAAIKEEAEANAKRGGQSVGSRFSSQLRELIAELDATGLHFVRCIKPNAALAPNHWEEAMVLHQLRCCGVLEVARIARAGFPTRYTHQAFAERYVVLLPPDQQAALMNVVSKRHSGSGVPAPAPNGTRGAGPVCADSLAAVKRLLAYFQLSPEEYQVGRTKVFFRPGVLGKVEDKWAAMQAGALNIQSTWRMYRQRKAFTTLRAAARTFQAVVRSKTERKKYLVLREQARAALVFQAAWRGHAARSSYRQLQRNALVIQCAWRRSRFNRRVRRRVVARQKRELEEKLKQDNFTSIQEQYGCDMEDVRSALAAWQAARASGGDGAAAQEALMAAMMQSQAKKDAAKKAPAPAAAAAPAGPPPAAVPEASARSLGSGGGSAALDTSMSTGAQAIAIANARQAAVQEAKEAAEKLTMDNMRLAKQLALERSLKDRYQHKYEEQNALWLDQIKVLQEYIQQVRAAFGDARLPPLPTALAATTAPHGDADGSTTPGGSRINRTGSRGGATPFSMAHGNANLASRSMSDCAVQVQLIPGLAPVGGWGRMGALRLDGGENGVDGEGPDTPGRHDAGDYEFGDVYPDGNIPVRGRPFAQTRGPLSSDGSANGRIHSPFESAQYTANAALKQPQDSLPVPVGQPRLAGGGSSGVAANAPPATKYVAQLAGEFGKVQQVLEDDVQFINEVGSGRVFAPDMDPTTELKRMRDKFKLWRKEFEAKLQTAEDVLRKLDKMNSSQLQSQQYPPEYRGRSTMMMPGGGMDASGGLSGQLSVSNSVAQPHGRHVTMAVPHGAANGSAGRSKGGLMGKLFSR